MKKKFATFIGGFLLCNYVVLYFRTGNRCARY